MRAAAIQLEAKVADVAANLAACERLAGEAAAAGAEVIALPEFFSTGIGFVPALARCALPPDGAATELLVRLARRHRALVGGSFLCRDADGEVRNAYLVVAPDGRVAGRHDKDLPTMWEHAFFVGGAPGDDGVIPVSPELTVGAAVCWELMRARTVERLRGRVDLVLAGSGWWSIPESWPLTRRAEARNAATARAAAESFGARVGAPIVHAAHAGALECDTPWIPLRYRGWFEGGAVVCDAAGRVLARRERREGAGIAVADVEVGRRTPAVATGGGTWLHPRGALPAFAWTIQRLHGRRWYRRHVKG